MDPKERTAEESDTAASTMQEEAPPVAENENGNAGSIDVVNNKPVFKPTREFLLAFSALLVVSLAVAFDATSLSVALATISAELGGTALEAFWSGTSFLLASTVLQPTVASLSTMFGRKYVSQRAHAHVQA